jgi:histidine triad (HIT) family protein
MKMEGCLFCKIINKEIKGEIIYEDDLVIAFKDINPQAPVHVLLIPKKHISGLSEIQEEDKLLLGHIPFVVKNIAKDRGIFDSGFRVVVNSGPDAGQAVDHLHFHVLGGRKLTWPPG